MWAVAWSCWVLAGFMVVVPGYALAAIESGAVSLSWSQLLTLLGLAAAWGDMRQQVKSLRDKVDDLEERHMKRNGGSPK